MAGASGCVVALGPKVPVGITELDRETTENQLPTSTALLDLDPIEALGEHETITGPGYRTVKYVLLLGCKDVPDASVLPEPLFG